MTSYHKALCDLLRSVDSDISQDPILCEIELGPDEDNLPERIMLLPKGNKTGLVKARDGREFYNKDPDQLIRNFKRNRQDLPVDINHSSELGGLFGGDSPAMGWITGLEVKSGAVWGTVSWTTQGAFLLRSRSYRYISPAFLHDDEGVVVQFTSAGLTNRPALVMPAVAHTQQGAKKMDKELLELLGLDETATKEEVKAALASFKAKQKETEEKAAKADEVAQSLAAVTDENKALKARVEENTEELAKARAAVPGLDRFVPREDFDNLRQELAATRQQITQTEEVSREREINSLVEGALKEGKITPATKDFYLETCRQEGGIESFKKFLATAAVVVPNSGGVNTNDDPPTENDAPTQEALDIAARCGVTPDSYKAAM